MKPVAQLMADLSDHKLIAGGTADSDGLSAKLQCCGYQMFCIVSWGMGWDHVSVSLPRRAPTWAEMCFVKDFFFMPTECAIQYHPPLSSYVNLHKHCLHLWRPQGLKLPVPPIMMV